MTSGKWRSFTNHVCRTFVWNLGIALQALFVYLIPNLQSLELYYGLAAFPLMLLWYFMPESPRWLLSKGQNSRAVKIFKTACKFNGRKYESGLFPSLEKDEGKEQKSSFFDLFRTQSIRRNTMGLCTVWFVICFSYFGLMNHTPEYNWNVYLVFAFPALILMPTALVQPYLENTFGRKPMLTFPLLLAGLSLIVTQMMEQYHLELPVIIMSWIGVVFTDVSIANSYTFTRELYPTSIRTTALATASIMARFGAIASPYVALLGQINSALPLMVYGMALLVAGLISLWIWPDTKNVELAHIETIEDCEALASSPNSWTCQKKR